MSNYTVKQLARLSGVSVRALHHYDEIGLLKPSFVGENRYRYYGREELLRLQDILFHRELGVPLDEIGKLLVGNGRDRVAILCEHRERLIERIEHSRQLLQTIDRTIAQLNGEGTMSDKDFYHGFAPEKQAEYEEWLVEQAGERMRKGLDDNKAYWAKQSPEAMRAAIEEGGLAEDALLECFVAGKAPDSSEIEPALERHRAWIGRMWGKECPLSSYGGMADLYSGHPGFRERYEGRGEGFTDWLTTAMKAYAARG